MLKLKDFFNLQTTKDANVILSATIINSLFGLLFFALAPRLIGPDAYGVFTTITATIIFVASIANLAMDTGIIKFAKDEANIDKFLTLALRAYVAIGLFISLTGLIFSSHVANFLNLQAFTVHFQISFLALIFFLLTNYYIAAFQSKKDFLKASLISISSNILRLLGLLIFFHTFSSNLTFLIILFFYVYILPVFLGIIMLNFQQTQVGKKDYLKFFKFNLPIAISLVISSFPYENYFLIKTVGPVYAGLYSAPVKLLSFSHQLGGNLSKIFATYYATAKSKEKLKEHTLKLSPFVFIFITGLLSIIIFSKQIIFIFFGSEYADSVHVLQIASIGFVLFFASIIPSSIILYHFGKSQATLLITAIKYSVLILALIYFVPTQKAFGAAIAFTASELVSFALMLIITFYYYKKNV